MATAKNWTTIAESSFPWEREALEFVRAQFPPHEPYRAWSNFEFIADDGSVNEVDLLLFTPQGCFLVEIKSKPGRLRGDVGTWTWESDGKLTTVDNPYQLANSKAKKLRSLLQRQKACKNKGQVPFIDAIVFCSAPDLRCELQGTARHHVCLRDRAAEGDKPARPGILAAIKRRECDGLDPYAKGTHNSPIARMVAQAMEQAGIRPSKRSRKVSDYELDHLINEGPGYQDWQATHSTLKNVRRRVRSYAGRLGNEADTLADEDPLVPPTRVLQRLREVSLPADATMLTDARLVRLAAAASKHAAVSSRQELYPRGMDAARAIKLSQGALYGVPFLTVQQIRDRVGGRYPEAVALPDRPVLDELLRSAGFDFNWDGTGKGVGCYVSRLRDAVSITSGSESVARLATSSSPIPAGEITPEIADARQFEERLERGIKEGSFLALLVNPKCYQRAAQELCERFPVELMDFEGLFIDALRDVASKAGAKWEAIVNADAVPGSEPWKKFMILVNRAIPMVEQRLNTATKTMLLTYPGLLARYDQMPLLERLREKVGRREGIPGVWLLIPGDNNAMLDGKAIPIISPGQRARIPEKWICNGHRAVSQEKAGT